MLAGMSSWHPEMCQLISAVCQRIQQTVPPDCLLDAETLCTALQGMRQMCTHHTCCISVLQMLCDRCSADMSFDATSFAAALSGMRSMADCTESRGLLVVLVKGLDPQEQLPAHQISFALQGLRQMSSSQPEVLAALNFLAAQVPSANGWTPETISCALAALANRSQQEPPVCHILGSITRKVQVCGLVWEARHVLQALAGLRGIGQNAKEVRVLVEELSGRLSNCSLDGLSIHQMELSGLKHVTDAAHRGRLIEQAVKGIECSPHQDITIAARAILKGMACLASNCTEVTTIIQALQTKLCEEEVNLDCIVQLLKNCVGLSSAELLVQLLAAWLREPETPLDSTQVIQLKQLLSLHHRQPPPWLAQAYGTVEHRCAPLVFCKQQLYTTTNGRPRHSSLCALLP